MPTETEVWRNLWSSFNMDERTDQPDRLVTDLILSLMDHTSRRSVLEVGAGRGIDSINLSSSGLDVTCLDITCESLDLIGQYEDHFSATTRKVQGDAFSLPFANEAFDLVFSQGLIEHFTEEEREQLIDEQKRVLGDDGYLIIDVPNRYAFYYTWKKRKAQKRRDWQFGWETEFSLKEVLEMGKDHGLSYVRWYSRQYDFPFNVVRRLHSNRVYSIPSKLGEFYEAIWRYIDKIPLQYFRGNIGAVFKKDSR